MTTVCCGKYTVFLLILLTNLFIVGCVYSQKISERSGKKPDFVDWVHSNSFRGSIDNTGDGLVNGKYYFVDEASLPAYYRQGANEYGYRPMQVVRAAADNIRAEVASMIQTKVMDSADRHLVMNGIQRKNFEEYVSKLLTEQTISGLFRESYYYQKEKYPEYTDYHAWALYSIDARRLEGQITNIIQEISRQTGTDPQFHLKVIEDIRTSVESLDDSDLSQN